MKKLLRNTSFFAIILLILMQYPFAVMGDETKQNGGYMGNNIADNISKLEMAGKRGGLKVSKDAARKLIVALMGKADALAGTPQGKKSQFSILFQAILKRVNQHRFSCPWCKNWLVETGCSSTHREGEICALYCLNCGKSFEGKPEPAGTETNPPSSPYPYMIREIPSPSFASGVE